MSVQILLIDDDLTIHFLVRHMLDQLADEFETELKAVDNGFDGLKELSDLSSFPDIIMLDISMPVMNGWDFLNRVKQQNLPIHLAHFVMISNSSYESKRNEMAGYSFIQDFIHKPVTKEMIREVLQKVEIPNGLPLKKNAS